jgi:hypothetical protein
MNEARKKVRPHTQRQSLSDLDSFFLLLAGGLSFLFSAKQRTKKASKHMS